MFEITCEHVKKSRFIDETIVSTDSLRIAKIAKKFNFNVPFIRPKKLALKTTPEWKVWRHALINFKNQKGYVPNTVVICSCTSPKRDPKIIDKAIKQFYKSKSDVVLSITKTSSNPKFNLVKIKKNRCIELYSKPKRKIYNRQDLDPVYKITTNVYVLKASQILKNKHIFESKKIDFIIVKKENSIDIDDIYDFNIAKNV